MNDRIDREQCVCGLEKLNETRKVEWSLDGKTFRSLGRFGFLHRIRQLDSRNIARRRFGTSLSKVLKDIGMKILES